MFCFRQCLTFPKFSCWIIFFKQWWKDASKAFLPVEIRSSGRKKSLFFSNVLSGRLLFVFILKWVFFALLGCPFLSPEKDSCLHQSSLEDKCDPALGEALDLSLGNGKPPRLHRDVNLSLCKHLSWPDTVRHCCFTVSPEGTEWALELRGKQSICAKRPFELLFEHAKTVKFYKQRQKELWRCTVLGESLLCRALWAPGERSPEDGDMKEGTTLSTFPQT